MIRNVPPGLVAKAKAKAKEWGGTLDNVLIAAMQDWANGKSPQQMGSSGGHARAASLTPEERSAIAKKAAETRWKDKP